MKKGAIWIVLLLIAVFIVLNTGLVLFEKVKLGAIRYVIDDNNFDESELDYVIKIVPYSKRRKLSFVLYLFPKDASSYNSFNCVITYEKGQYHYFVATNEGY